MCREEEFDTHYQRNDTPTNQRFLESGLFRAVYTNPLVSGPTETSKSLTPNTEELKTLTSFPKPANSITIQYT